MSIHDMNKFVVLPGILQDATDKLDVFKLFKMVEKGARMLSQRKGSFTPSRRMVTLEHGLVSGIDFIKNFLNKVFRDEIDEALAVSDCNLLLACPGVTQQVRHADFCVSDDYPPSENYIVFVSIIKGTKIVVFDETKTSSEILLNEGDVFVGRGDLLHAGAAYEKYNVRLHFYITRNLCPLPKNETYLY